MSGFEKEWTNGVPVDNDMVDALLDLPHISEEDEENIFGHIDDWESEFQRLGPIPSDIFDEFQQNDATSHAKESSLFHDTSPISVLDSRSACSSALKSISTSPELLIPVRTRTKRPRLPNSCRWQFITPLTPGKTLNKEAKEQKKRKVPQLSDDAEDKENCSNQPMSIKRCSHCQVEKTPQWRNGPEGPRTLCNACGVRYRSGRLLPEYRPAASPTFIPSLHSNSHRKVIEMRNKSIQESYIPQMSPTTFCDANRVPFDARQRDGQQNLSKTPAMLVPPVFGPMSRYLFDFIPRGQG